MVKDISEFMPCNDHEITMSKESKEGFVKVEPSVVCHDGESIQVLKFVLLFFIKY